MALDMKLRASLRSFSCFVIALSLHLIPASPSGWAAEPGVVVVRGRGEVAGTVEFRPEGLRVQSTDSAQPAHVPLTDLESLRLHGSSFPDVVLGGDEQRDLRPSGFALPGFSNQLSSAHAARLHFPAAGTTWKRDSAPPASVRWDGLLVPVTNGVHKFRVVSSGLARLWVNAHCVASILATNELRESSGDLFLRADRRYPILLEFSQTEGPGEISAFWTTPGRPSSLIPGSRLIHSPSSNALAGVSRGLLGAYYGSPDFTNLRTYRVDPQMDIYWGLKPPFPEIGVGTRFSTIWTGTLEVPRTDGYRFEFAMEGGYRCTLDQDMIQIRWDDIIEAKASMASFPIQIDSGRPHPLKIEFYNEVGRALVLTRFLGEEPGRTVVFSEGLKPASPPDFSLPAQVSDSKKPTATAPGALPAGILMNDGSFIAQSPRSATKTRISLQEGVVGPDLALELVSRINLSEVSPALAAGFDTSRVGAYLHTGDFVEGEFQGMDTNYVRLGSVLFGNHRLDRERVLALVLRNVVPTPAAWEVRTRNGSLFLEDELEMIPEGIKVLRNSGRPCLVAATLLAEIRRGTKKASTP